MGSADQTPEAGDEIQRTRAGEGPRATRDAPKLIAFYDSTRPPMRLTPAPRRRAWMDETTYRYANRCLPLLVANQAGWVVLNPHTFQVTWTGDNHTSALAIEFAEAEAAPQGADDSRFAYVDGRFGFGIITWILPFLFRTPPGYNLLARGPANWPKDGIYPLEGLVETDWTVASFTMNWKVTRPNHPVTFAADEPFCMVVPQRRGELESFRPELSDIESDPQTHAGHERWSELRGRTRARKLLYQLTGDVAADRKTWEGHYFKGMASDGTEAETHQTRLRLSDFAESDG